MITRDPVMNSKSIVSQFGMRLLLCGGMCVSLFALSLRRSAQEGCEGIHKPGQVTPL
jgi:hypothetical protein